MHDSDDFFRIERDANPDAIEVYVEPCDALPDGASLRYKTAGESRVIDWVHFESDDGEEGIWDVWSPRPGDAAARDVVWAVPVHDSSAGVSLLVYGGVGGLRLRWRDDATVVVAEAWLLLSDGDAG